MLITGKRIRNVKTHLRTILNGTRIIVGISDLKRFDNKLRLIGFSDDRNYGETVLPPSTFGPVSRYNAEGKYKIHRDRPMETCYRMGEWHWHEWRGRYEREEKSRIVDIPYPRYPRTFISPPSIEFTISKSALSDRIITTIPIQYIETNIDNILHRINLCLEIFSECIIFTDKLEQILNGSLKRLNWHVLPPGQMPWKSLAKEIQPIIEEAPAVKQAIISSRLERVNYYKPEFVAIGRAGFRGYVIFGFPSKSRYVLESIYEGNATYVFKHEWEKLSQMTKAEILNQNLHEYRIIHRESWYGKIDNILC